VHSSIFAHMSVPNIVQKHNDVPSQLVTQNMNPKNLLLKGRRYVMHSSSLVGH